MRCWDFFYTPTPPPPPKCCLLSAKRLSIYLTLRCTGRWVGIFSFFSNNKFISHLPYGINQKRLSLNWYSRKLSTQAKNGHTDIWVLLGHLEDRFVSTDFEAKTFKQPFKVVWDTHGTAGIKKRSYSIAWLLSYSRLQITRTFRGNRKRFELSGVRDIEGKII